MNQMYNSDGIGCTIFNYARSVKVNGALFRVICTPTFIVRDTNCVICSKLVTSHQLCFLVWLFRLFFGYLVDVPPHFLSSVKSTERRE